MKRWLEKHRDWMRVLPELRRTTPEHRISRDGVCLVAARGRSGSLLGSCLLVLVNTGCTAVLGVDEAQCDPNFDEACSGGDVEPEPATEDEQTTAPEPEPDAGSPEEQLAAACTEYCELVIDACEDIPQFKTASGCQSVCEGMYHLEGAANDNTVQCRMLAAENALNFSDGMEDNCVSAGPMGLSCGGACDNYCEQIERYCPEEFEKMDDCVAECRDVPRADVPYTDDFPAGNTLECRVYHAQLAVLQQPNRLLHCGHAAGRSLCADE